MTITLHLWMLPTWITVLAFGWALAKARDYMDAGFMLSAAFIVSLLAWGGWGAYKLGTAQRPDCKGAEATSFLGSAVIVPETSPPGMPAQPVYVPDPAAKEARYKLAADHYATCLRRLKRKKSKDPCGPKRCGGEYLREWNGNDDLVPYEFLACMKPKVGRCQQGASEAYRSCVLSGANKIANQDPGADPTYRAKCRSARELTQKECK